MPKRPCWIALQWPPSPEPQAGDPLATQPPVEADAGWVGWVGLWALQFTPQVARLEDAWLLDVTATLRLWGGLPRLLQRLRAQWPEPSHPLALAVAFTPLGALARCRTHPSRNALDDAACAESPHLLTPAPLLTLPLHSLSAWHAQVPVLARLGVHTWAQLERLPRAGVVRRWGAEGLQALDQALGRRPQPLRSIQAPPVFSHTLELAQAQESAAALMGPVRQLLAALHGWLVLRHQGVCAVRWRWVHDARRDVPTHGEWALHLAQPVQQLDHLQHLTAEHLAQVHWPAPVVALGLDTLDLAPWAPTTVEGLLSPGPTQATLRHPLRWTELLERLRARLGHDAVVQWQLQDTHLSEASQRPRPPTPSTATAPARHRGAAPPAPEAPPWPCSPTWLADPPVPLRLQGDRPVYQGPLELLAGPHRIEWVQWPGAPEPLHGQPLPVTVRDHFLARSPGAGLVWVVRQPGPARPDGVAHDAPAWFLQGWMA
jgi:protein ImuB